IGESCGTEQDLIGAFAHPATLTSREAVRALLTCPAMACANGGGKAFPTCLYAAVFPPLNCQSSGKPWRRATIRTVRRGIPSVGKSGPGASFAIPSPSTPSAAHARLALVGPRSGPPCLWEPPTTVGAISSAWPRQVFAPIHPIAAIKSQRTSPTVFGLIFNGSVHEKCSE